MINLFMLDFIDEDDLEDAYIEDEYNTGSNRVAVIDDATIRKDGPTCVQKPGIISSNEGDNNYRASGTWSSSNSESDSDRENVQSNKARSISMDVRTLSPSAMKVSFPKRLFHVVKRAALRRSNGSSEASEQEGIEVTEDEDYELL
jgi:hypothetical protein